MRTLSFGRKALVAHLLLLTGSFCNSAVACAQSPKLEDAKKAIVARVEKSGAEVGIAFRTLDGKDEWYSRADESFHAASTMKVPVLIELFHQVKEGKLRLLDTLVIKNQFRSIVDGSPYKLDPADDSEAGLYNSKDETRTLGQLAELMITVSSNFATNLLVERLGVEEIRTEVHALGADGVNVLRGVEDGKAFEKGMNNTTTARGLAILMTAIAEGKAVDAESSKQMAEILERQKFNEAIPAGLPRGMRVAHKTGDITKIHHDAAIVYAKRPFVLVVLVRGIAEEKQAYALMASIAHDLYAATN
jgi:beta-lactamase class A